jgi:hypothetical protein
MSDENKNVVFLNPNDETMRALGLHNQPNIVVNPQVSDWSGRSAGEVIAMMSALADRIRRETSQPYPRKRMVRLSTGLCEVIPTNEAVYAVRGVLTGPLRFTESRRRQHSRVLKHWHEERCPGRVPFPYWRSDR